MSSSLKLSAIVVDRAIKGSFFCTESRSRERGGELVCGSSLPMKHATMAWEQVDKRCTGSPHLPLAHPSPWAGRGQQGLGGLFNAKTLSLPQEASS